MRFFDTVPGLTPPYIRMHRLSAEGFDCVAPFGGCAACGMETSSGILLSNHTVLSLADKKFDAVALTFHPNRISRTVKIITFAVFIREHICESA
jgi:hypothetical protein